MIFQCRYLCHHNLLNKFLAQYSTSESFVYALRSTKPKSARVKVQNFVDVKFVKAFGGNGGDGAISFLRLWCNPNAGPDGGDGGNGGHVACLKVKDLSAVPTVIKGEDGKRGQPKNCYGRSAEHLIVKVPVGTVIHRLHNDITAKDIESKPLWYLGGSVVGDLSEDGEIFVGARGGAGGHGNAFFLKDSLKAPQIAELGAKGEEGNFALEIRCISHFGLIGFPNAGKSTLLRAITRARPKVAPYPFTTLKPHLGIVKYSDHEQLSVADLPGLLPGAHKDRGLGLSFLRHAERCIALLLVVDASYACPWEQAEQLLFELKQFDPHLPSRSCLLIANKMDLPNAKENLEEALKHLKIPVIPVSAKMGSNLSSVVNEIRRIYDKNVREEENEVE
ncbi:hypothetical protein J437_LFUL008545 [Ladona fulva]|uniref:Mitochondrial ribosome-associated GTPase 2 n=1 Tax=Ladona fulva TaxID=123851 RepID=A0A8K0P1F3_LADFU|nr:hypothetical protein J437_LFUL008545 [Ladona fulva]